MDTCSPPVTVKRDGRAKQARDLCRRELPTVVMAALMLPALSGCLVTGDYPADWPEPTRGSLVGKCPSIDGRFLNAGAGHPTGAGSLLLTRLLDLPEGEQVEIAQSPERIEVTVWTGGNPTATATFTSVWLDPWADTVQPRTFQCPIDIPGGRILFFSHLQSQSVGGAGGMLAVGGHNMSFSRATDGSLIVTGTEAVGVLVGYAPVGRVERVYYRFEPVDP